MPSNALQELLRTIGATPTTVTPTPGGPSTPHMEFMSNLEANVPGIHDDIESRRRARDFTHRVGRIIDGDTIETQSGETVRLTGIDTPESKHPNVGPEIFAEKARQFLENQIPPGTGINLEEGFEEQDSRGRLLRFVEGSGFQNVDLIRRGLGSLTTFDHPRRAEFLDALEEAVVGGFGAFNVNERMAEMPTLQQAHEDNLKLGLPGLLDEQGNPTNPVFAEQFQRSVEETALRGLLSEVKEAEDIFNSLRREHLSQLNELRAPEEGEEAQIDELSELLPIKAGLQAARGEEVTAPVPTVDRLKRFNVQAGEGGIEVASEDGPIVGGHQDRPSRFTEIARAVEEALIPGEQDPGQSPTQRLLTKLGEATSRMGERVATVSSGVPRELSPDRLFEIEKVDFDPAEGIVTKAAEFAGEIGPEFALALVGPGAIPAGAIASTRAGVTLTRIGVNALENLGIEYLSPSGEDGDPQVIQAIALGAAFGAVFDAAGRIVDFRKARALSQDEVAQLINANPELSARVLTSMEDKIAAIKGPIETPVEFRSVDDLDFADDALRAATDDADVFSAVREGRAPETGTADKDFSVSIKRIVDDSELEKREELLGDAKDEVIDDALEAMDEEEVSDIISEAAHRRAVEAWSGPEARLIEKISSDRLNVAGKTRKLRIYKENLANTLLSMVKQQDFSGAWRVIHSRQVGRHLGEKEVEGLKLALIDKISEVAPDKAQSLEILESQARNLKKGGEKGRVVTLGDLIDLDPDAWKKVKGLDDVDDPALRRATDIEKMDPEAGQILNPFASRARRYEELQPYLKAALRERVIDQASPYTQKIQKWHNIVRDNLGRISRSGNRGAEDASIASRIMDEGRWFEEENQGGIIRALLRATDGDRPMSQYLLRGGSHHARGLSKFFNVGRERAWQNKQKQMWDAIANMETTEELHSASFGEMDDIWTRMISAMRISYDAADNKFFFNIRTSAAGARDQISFDLKDVQAAMAVSRQTTRNADIIDVFGGMYSDKITNYVRETFNNRAGEALKRLEKSMRASEMHQDDILFVRNMRRALKESGGTVSEALTILRSTTAMTRLPLVSVSNLPQLVHSAYRLRARNVAKALWRAHAPGMFFEGGVNPHRQRVREFALMDASGADAVIQEQADLLANFAKRIPADIAAAAGRPDLSDVPARARLADMWNNAARKFVGDIVGLKPTERWLRTITSEAGRLYNNDVIMKARRLMETDEGMNALRSAWQIHESIHPESPFWKSLKESVRDGPGSRVIGLVDDAKFLGQWEDFEHFARLRNFSEEQLSDSIGKYFNPKLVSGMRVLGNIPGGRLVDGATVGENEVDTLIHEVFRRSGKFAAEGTQFRVGLQDLPLSLNAPGGARDWLRTVMQFRTFNLKHFDTIMRRHVKDNIKRGNFVPLLRLVGVAFPLGVLAGELTRDIKAFIQGSEIPGGSTIDLAISYVSGKITDKEFERRLENMGRGDLLAARAWDDFNAWGGFGTASEVDDIVTRGPGGAAGLVGGAGPISMVSALGNAALAGSSLVEGDTEQAAGRGLTAVEKAVGNPLGITKTFTRRIREAEDLGRRLEEFNPTLLERLVRTPDQARASVVEQDAKITRSETADIRKELEDLFPEGREEGLPSNTTRRAEGLRGEAERSKSSTEFRLRYAQAIRRGDRAEARRVELEARRAGIRLQTKRIDERFGRQRR